MNSRWINRGVVWMAASACAGLVLCVGLAYAADRQVVGSDVTVGAGETQRGDLVVLNGNAVVRGTVKGSVIALAGNVVLDREAGVRGDVVALGGTVENRGATISGKVAALPGKGLRELLAHVPSDGTKLGSLAEACAAEAGEGRVVVGKPVTIGADERVNGDVIVLGSDLTVNGKVRGSAVAIGGALRVGDRADVADQALAVGGEARFDSGATLRGTALAVDNPWVKETVGKAVAAAGLAEASGAPAARAEEEPRRAATPPPAGAIGGDQTWHESHTIEDGQVYAGNVTVTRGDLTIRGRVDGNVTVVKGDIKMEGDAHVAGNVTTTVGDISLRDRASISGNCVTVKGDIELHNEARIDGDAVATLGKVLPHDSATVKGNSVGVGGLGIAAHTKPPSPPVPPVARAVARSPHSDLCGSVVVFGSLCLLCLLLVPRRVQNVDRAIQADPKTAFTWGLLAFLAFPLVVAILACLCVTLILVPIYVAWMAGLFILGMTGTNYLVGRLIARKMGWHFTNMLAPAGIGFAVLVFAWVLVGVPVVGVLVTLGLIALACLQLGGALMTDMGRETRPTVFWPLRRFKRWRDGGRRFSGDPWQYTNGDDTDYEAQYDLLAAQHGEGAPPPAPEPAPHETPRHRSHPRRRS
ncbi:MAG TPA: hypothetical protein PLD23_17105 [Armatimonadota bacterium]|nr:hypothetical protein [Armatimonadota bacterium]